MSSRIVSAEGLAPMNAWFLCHQAAGFGLLQHQPPRAVLVRPGRIKAGLPICPIFGRLFLWLPLIIYLARVRGQPGRGGHALSLAGGRFAAGGGLAVMKLIEGARERPRIQAVRPVRDPDREVAPREMSRRPLHRGVGIDLARAVSRPPRRRGRIPDQGSRPAAMLSSKIWLVRMTAF